MSRGGRRAEGQLALGLVAVDGARFDNYLDGPNAEAVATLRALDPGAPPRVIFVRGARGSGKTHLLAALCAACGERGLGATAISLTEHGGHSPALLSGLCELAVVCIDDVDAVAAVEAWEHALFALHERAEASGTRLVVAAREGPTDCGLRLPDLVSRLTAGLVLTLRALDENQCRRALQLRARGRGLELSDEVVGYLFRRWPRDLTTMLRLLDGLDRSSLASRRRITVPFVRDLVEHGVLRP